MDQASRALGTFRQSIDAIVDDKRWIEFGNQLSGKWSRKKRDHDDWTIAVTLLGYPERSVGRLMTPDYVAVHEGWTIRQVLDFVRTHGQDSETLNVIYVVDDHGVLIDDIRIREFLLTDPERGALPAALDKAGAAQAHDAAGRGR